MSTRLKRNEIYYPRDLRIPGFFYTWQYAAGALAASQAYDSITITLAYDYNANTAYFDGIQLYQERFGTTYSYDDNGNLLSAKDLQKQVTSYSYNADQDLTQIKMPSGEQVTYTYDDYHNVRTATTGLGVIYTYTYDTYGNNTSVTISNGKSDYRVITASATYTDGGNRLTSTTDSLGNVTSYSYGASTNLLNSVTYPNDTSATKTKYTYDDSYRLLTGVTATTDSGSELSAAYTYVDDQLTKLSTPTADYLFTYGNFGLRTKVQVGTLTLASYSYYDVTNYLKKLAYGNGDSVQYTYNSQGQVTGQTYEDGDKVTYRYGNSGELASVTDSGSGITQHYAYDLIDRLAQYRETGGHWEVTQTNTYNKYNQLKGIRETIGDRTCTTAVTYDDDGRVATYRKYNSRVTYTYESRGRLSTMVTNHTYGDGKDILTETYTYRNPADGKTSAQVSKFRTQSIGDYDVTYEYTYDANGNILSAYDGTYRTRYEYDSAGQLLRENNYQTGKTWIYTYDDAGNITSKSTYAYTRDEDPGTPIDTITYGYTNENWGDLLKSYDGTTLTYDNCANLLSGPGWRYSWEHGRQLATMTAKDGSATWNFTYNADGLRTGRTNGTTTYKYQYLNGQLVKMTVADKEMYFNYDASGVPVSIVYNGTSYYYVTNLQGDVVGIVNQSGNQLVAYTYDAWGNVLTTTGSSAGSLGKYNPLRYRGYVYDVETKLYYLQSRYYNPEWGRFINADALVATGQGLLGNNMFAYCNNNPIRYIDPYGTYTRQRGFWNGADESATSSNDPLWRTTSIGYSGAFTLGPYVFGGQIALVTDDGGYSEVQFTYFSPLSSSAIKNTPSVDEMMSNIGSYEKFTDIFEFSFTTNVSFFEAPSASNLHGEGYQLGATGGPFSFDYNFIPNGTSDPYRGMTFSCGTSSIDFRGVAGYTIPLFESPISVYEFAEAGLQSFYGGS